jgi:hypothetical protein
MQKFVFSFENKRKLRPDCMIVEITNDEIDRALRKRTRNGDTNIPTQINSRPRKIWLIELGYSFDTRYMDKVTEKKNNMQSCANCLPHRGMMYCCSPSSWEVLGHFLNALIVQQKRWTF